MPESVNFVKHRRKLLTKRQEQDKQIFRYALIGVGVVFVLFLVVTGIRLYLAYSVKQIQTKEGQFKQLVVDQQQNEQSYVIFAAKIKALVDLFAKRRDKQQAIGYFSSAFGTNVLLSSIDYEEDGSILSLGLQSSDIFVLENVFNTLKTPEVQQQFQSLALSDLKRSSDGSYKVTATVVLKSNTATAAATTNASPQP